MWRRLVSSSSAQLQTVTSTPCASGRSFLIYSSSSSATTLFQGSFTLSSFHASFASSVSSALATNHEHYEAESVPEGRNNTYRQSATYSGYYSQNNQRWQQNPNAVYADSSRAPQQSSNQFSHNYSRGFMGSNEFAHNSVEQSGNFSGFHGSMQQNSYLARQERPREVGQIPVGFNSESNLGSDRSMNHSSVHKSAEYQQNTIGYNRGIISPQKQQNLNDYYTDNWHYQQGVRNGKYQSSLNVSEYQQSPHLGQNQQIPSVGEYQQTSQVGEYQQTSQVGQPAEDSDGNPNSINGTLEELDLFCKELKVKEAVQVLGMLERQNMHVNLERYLQLIHACGEASALEEAKAVHEKMRLLFSLGVSTYNKILEMYSKCGSMENASMVFEGMPKRNMTSWDIMITWLAKNGFGEDAIDRFTEFKKAGLKPDGQMFLGVFRACSVVKDADEGLLHFKSMSKDYSIVPTMDHYVSVVDMLGSIGYLDEALEFIKKMPLEPNVDVWKTLMHYCRVHGCLELGDHCAELVDQLDPSSLNDQSKAGLIPVNESDLIKESAPKNLFGVKSQQHEYRAGDKSPHTEKLYTLLRGLREQMKEAGYIPETRYVLHDIDQEGKEDALLSHSERLAVADGLLGSAARSPIRIIKNLRVCGDCHTACKIISKIVGRELIMRDAKRYHHLKDGTCSCKDYW